jgi:hypothetical protein
MDRGAAEVNTNLLLSEFRFADLRFQLAAKSVHSSNINFIHSIGLMIRLSVVTHRCTVE